MKGGGLKDFCDLSCAQTCLIYGWALDAELDSNSTKPKAVVSKEQVCMEWSREIRKQDTQATTPTMMCLDSCLFVMFHVVPEVM